MAALNQWLIPVILFATIALAAMRRTQAYDAFLEGARDGLIVLWKIFPAVAAMLCAIAVLRASGAMELLAQWCAPVLSLVGLPPELLPLALVKPLSGAGALASLQDVLLQYGPDSVQGRIASVMMGSSETVFYVLAVYFGAAGVKRARYALPVALVSSLAGTLASAWICRLFYG